MFARVRMSQTYIKRPSIQFTHPNARVPTSRAEHIQRGVHAEGINARIMAMIVTNDFVDLQIPAFDHLGVSFCLYALLTLSSAQENRYG